jgi:dynein heavy chain 1
MNALKAHAEEWLGVLPKVSVIRHSLSVRVEIMLNSPQVLSSVPAASSPLARFFVREASTGRTLLARIRRDLSDLIEVCNGQLKQTNELRALMSDLNKGEWRVVVASTIR